MHLTEDPFYLGSHWPGRQGKFRACQKERKRRKSMAEWKRNKIHERNKKMYNIPQRPVSRVSDTAASLADGRVDRLSVKYLQDAQWTFKRVTINAAGCIFFSQYLCWPAVFLFVINFIIIRKSISFLKCIAFFT